MKHRDTATIRRRAPRRARVYVVRVYDPLTASHICYQRATLREARKLATEQVKIGVPRRRCATILVPLETVSLARLLD